MNLYETEALTLDPERRDEDPQLLMYFFFYLCFVLLPSGLINVHGAFLTESLYLMEKGKTSKEKKHQAALLHSFHA